MDVANLSGSAIARSLASCSKATRDRALRLLVTWLSSTNSASVSDEDLHKVWKGLFYCMWHADGLSFQVDLVNRLSSILASLDLPLSARYFDAFLSTIRREWSGIDHLRLDKFYLLVRRFVNKLFVFLRYRKWEKDVVDRMAGVLGEKTLLFADKCPANGVNFHISQVYLDEMVVFLPLSVETLEALMKPFFTAMEQSLDKVLVKKIKSCMFDRLLENGRKYLELEKRGELELGSEVEKFGKVALGLGFSQRFLASATAPETLTGNRKVLFNLHHGFLKLEKDLKISEVEVSFKLENGPMSTDAAAHETPLCASDCGQPGKLDAANGKTSCDGQFSNDGGKSFILVDLSNPCTSVLLNGGIGVTGDMNVDKISDGNVDLLDEATLSNLQLRFEKVAAETGMMTPVSILAPKKRRRTKFSGKAISDFDGNADGKDGEKSVKRVKFSMKNNLIWKPHTPLPPQSLRIPPSAAPKGSALKKGLPPGPVKDCSNNTKAKSSCKKKIRKISRRVSPAVKRLRKLKSCPA